MMFSSHKFFKLILLTLGFLSNIALLHTASPVLVVPGICGSGYGLTSYVAEQLAPSSSDSILEVDSPIYTDFGQSVCQKYLSKKFNALEANQNFLLHASSQGTATALNFLATYPHAQERLKALILESPMASANNTISHRFNISAFAGNITLPYLARLFFLRYRPSGMQAIKSIDKLLNKDFPIIIVHATGDNIVPYSGACALYYRLKEQGHKHVYFISKKSKKHFICLLNDNSIVRTILETHAVLLTKQTPKNDLTQYQPDHMQYRTIYEKLRFIEKVHTVIDPIFTGACAIYMLYYIMMLSGIYI